jgi:hypothetical protein
VSMDANFGLVRKKNAGKSLSDASYGSRFFVSDSAVNEFVDSYSDRNVKDDVSDFWYLLCIQLCSLRAS